MWIFAFILLLVYALSSFAEIAFTSCDMIKLRGLSNRTKNARFTYGFLKNTERFLSTVLLVANLSLVGLSVSLSNISIRWQWIENLLPFLITFVILMFGEIVPKGIAYRFAFKGSLFLSRPFTIIYWAFFPAITLMRRLAGGILAICRVTKKEKAIITKEEVRVGVAGLPSLERKLILRMLNFSGKRVEEVLVQRNRITAVPLSISIKALIEKAETTGHSRIPVYLNDIDNIIGFVRIKEVIKGYIKESSSERRERWLMRFIHKAMFVPPNKRIEDLMEKMKKEYRYIAIVKDEYGGTAGLVTLEDILEELFGEIRDEYDFLE